MGCAKVFDEYDEEGPSLMQDQETECVFADAGIGARSSKGSCSDVAIGEWAVEG